MPEHASVTLTLDTNGRVIVEGVSAAPARTVMLAGKWGADLPAEWHVSPEALEVLTALGRDIDGWF